MISVCIATYNGEAFIKEQIDSILAQLLPEDEIIVSDDGSTDATLAILSSYQDDKVSLSTLYHIQGNLDNLVSNRVWLKSGANIIIESLETLTVIDVNTGKNISKKADTIFRVNIEAAKEVARQLRLRNISGMIIIDFINMTSEEDKKRLINVLKKEIQKDSVRCSFIDITKLGLVELTRKKVRKSLKDSL